MPRAFLLLKSAKLIFVQSTSYSSLFSSQEHTLAQLTRGESDLGRDSLFYECSFIEVALYSMNLFMGGRKNN